MSYYLQGFIYVRWCRISSISIAFSLSLSLSIILVLTSETIYTKQLAFLIFQPTKNTRHIISIISTKNNHRFHKTTSKGLKNHTAFFFTIFVRVRKFLPFLPSGGGDESASWLQLEESVDEAEQEDTKDSKAGPGFSFNPIVYGKTLGFFSA